MAFENVIHGFFLFSFIIFFSLRLFLYRVVWVCLVKSIFSISPLLSSPLLSSVLLSSSLFTSPLSSFHLFSPFLSSSLLSSPLLSSPRGGEEVQPRYPQGESALDGIPAGQGQGRNQGVGCVSSSQKDYRLAHVPLIRQKVCVIQK